MKVGLYSISCSGVWFNDRPALTVEEFVDTAKKYGYDGVEIDLKRPHGSPIDLDSKRCKEIRDYVAGKGLEMCAAAANNNFATIVPEICPWLMLILKSMILKTAIDVGEHMPPMPAYLIRRCIRHHHRHDHLRSPST